MQPALFKVHAVQVLHRLVQEAGSLRQASSDVIGNQIPHALHTTGL